MGNVKRIVLFLVDGMRPDGLIQAATPALDALIAAGAHTFSGRTVFPSFTLPCLTSLFLSVEPARHGVTANVWTPSRALIPGLMDVLHLGGKKAVSFYNWEELRELSRPGTLEAAFFLRNRPAELGGGDAVLAELAASWLRCHDFDFAFIYFGTPDLIGHAYGWMSEPYLQSIATADRCIGQVLDALPDGCGVMVTSDHGGHDLTHGTDCEEDMTTPFIIQGVPFISPGSTLAQPVRILDIAPTIVTLLGLYAPPMWEGRALTFEPA